MAKRARRLALGCLGASSERPRRRNERASSDPIAVIAATVTLVAFAY